VTGPTARVLDFETARREREGEGETDIRPRTVDLWRCSCGGETFYLTRRQVLCAGCGAEHEWRPEG
jgi:hypothetical protein